MSIAVCHWEITLKFPAAFSGISGITVMISPFKIDNNSHHIAQPCSTLYKVKYYEVNS